MNKDLVIHKENIFTKIRNFFLKAFRKNTEGNEKRCKNNVSNNNSGFMNNIIIKDAEEQRIVQLQQDYKDGRISEQDILKEDYEKLIELYKKQNSELKHTIESKKISLRKRINALSE